MRVLTIDFECWPQMVYGELTGQDRAVGRDGLERATDTLLALTERHGVRATVFVLGVTARAFPDLVRRIHAAGHELGAHGETHERLDRLTPARRQASMRAVKARLEDLVGAPIRGFRAPYFSIVRSNLDALEELADAGFAYDSSIVPIVHRRYGVPGWPRGPERVAGGRLVELPLATVAVGAGNLPVAGGGYWRALPDSWVVRGLEAANDQPAVVYLHPYQLDPQPPEAVPGPLGPLNRLRAGAFRLAQRLGRSGNPALLDRVLQTGQWTTAGELVDAFLTAAPPSATPGAQWR